jgi:hypothetical protein
MPGLCLTTNAAGNITSLLGKTLAYDAVGRLSETTAVPPCPSGSNCAGQQTTLSRFNGWGQRYLRDTPNAQSVFSSGTEGFNLLSETTRYLSTSALSTTEHIYLPTASGPMPIAAVIDGVHYAVHADHLNTPRRLTDGAKAVKWQWSYSGFGEIAPQSTPAAGQAPLNYSLRYPGQQGGHDRALRGACAGRVRRQPRHLCHGLHASGRGDPEHPARLRSGAGHGSASGVPLADALKRRVGFRNVAVLDYQGMQLPITVRVITAHLHEFLDYSQALLQQVPRA